jgi:hypothetical protein
MMGISASVLRSHSGTLAQGALRASDARLPERQRPFGDADPGDELRARTQVTFPNAGAGVSAVDRAASGT